MIDPAHLDTGQLWSPAQFVIARRRSTNVMEDEIQTSLLTVVRSQAERVLPRGCVPSFRLPREPYPDGTAASSRLRRPAPRLRDENQLETDPRRSGSAAPGPALMNITSQVPAHHAHYTLTHRGPRPHEHQILEKLAATTIPIKPTTHFKINMRYLRQANKVEKWMIARRRTVCMYRNLY